MSSRYLLPALPVVPVLLVALPELSGDERQVASLVRQKGGNEECQSTISSVGSVVECPRFSYVILVRQLVARIVTATMLRGSSLLLT